MKLTHIISSFVLLLSVNTAHAAGMSETLGTPNQEPRDPFTTSAKMYAEVGNQSAAQAGNGQGFVAGYGPQSAPRMKLKGFVNRGSKKMVALLDIEGAGVYLVSEGDEIGLQAIGQNSVIKIIKVDINGVRVQTGQVNQVILVR